MFLLLISCFSVILLSKSLSSKIHQGIHSKWRLFQKGKLGIFSFIQITPLKKMKTKPGSSENQNEDHNTSSSSSSLLDLPELTLECILDRLSPAGLCAMAGVCSSLRDRCTSDHLWEKHMKRKWSKVIGDAAYKELQWHIASKMKPRNLLDRSEQRSFICSICEFGHFLSKFCFKPRTENGEIQLKKSGLPVDSIIALYLALETGEFWFPAQVYNRENGHAGFLLSCYDAKLSYDSKTDTFQARYSPYGRRMTEENISWDRLRVPPVNTCSYDLYSSDSLLDLKPGDHIEIQWRKTNEFPYGWWYGVVVHMESCGGTENHCRCPYTDTVMLEFKQYPSSSRWRKTTINRKDHREVGNEADGFYGGIRKLYIEEEISMWKRLCPNHELE
ncbi:F-box protein [Hibiscus syriacus]|uniref:F-box protein n=1 Tax=Hibiscus syriacus TaxID=106335 RepID=A0A6A3D3X8_HIBSY|nr:F-box protein At2g26850-like [Hibiscus syriacus]KAE8733959.1 F-box protein [Hibiscus syriacus]